MKNTIGDDVEFAFVLDASSAGRQGALQNLAPTLPIFQSTPQQDAFGIMGGRRDSVFVFKRNGEQALAIGGFDNTQISNAVQQALVEEP